MRFAGLGMTSCLTLSILTFAPVTASAADTLHLRNGDKLTGQITHYTPNQVNIKTKYGMFELPVTDLGGVETLNDEAAAAIAQSISGAHDTLTPAPASAANMQAQSQPAPTPPIEVVENTQEGAAPEPGLWGAFWSGSANLGAGLRSGNSEKSNINSDLNLKAKWEKHRAEIKADYNHEKEDGDVTVDDKALELTHDYFFRPKWFIETTGRFEQDETDELDLRTIASSGLGYQPYDRDDLSLKFVLGPGYLREDYDTGESESAMTAQWSLDYAQQFYNDLFRIFHEHDISAPADDFNAYLFQSESGIRIPLRKGIIASGQVDFDWDNDPAMGTQEDDTIYSLRLGYEWEGE